MKSKKKNIALLTTGLVVGSSLLAATTPFAKQTNVEKENGMLTSYSKGQTLFNENSMDNKVGNANYASPEKLNSENQGFDFYAASTESIEVRRRHFEEHIRAKLKVFHDTNNQTFKMIKSNIKALKEKGDTKGVEEMQTAYKNLKDAAADMRSKIGS